MRGGVEETILLFVIRVVLSSSRISFGELGFVILVDSGGTIVVKAGVEVELEVIGLRG